MDVRESGPGGKWADEKSAQDVSQDERLAQRFGHTTTHDGGTEDVGEISKESGFHCRGDRGPFSVIRPTESWDAKARLPQPNNTLMPGSSTASSPRAARLPFGAGAQVHAAEHERDARACIGISGFKPLTRRSGRHDWRRALPVSGYDQTTVQRHRRDYMTSRFRQKPFSLRTLAHKIREILDAEALVPAAAAVRLAIRDS